jgi:hypothetical protein
LGNPPVQFELFCKNLSLVVQSLIVIHHVVVKKNGNTA